MEENKQELLLPCNHMGALAEIEKWITAHKNFVSIYTKETYRCKCGEELSKIKRNFFANGVFISLTESEEIPEHAEYLPEEKVSFDLSGTKIKQGCSKNCNTCLVKCLGIQASKKGN